MKVYTVIVTYNGMKWIEQCLKSIVNQSEVIVVDNNSSDETLNVIKINFPNVIVLAQHENHGFGIANNIGISYAIKKGADAVFLLNQDAFAQPNCILNLIKVSDNNPDFGIISPVHFNGDGSALDFTFQKITYMSKIISDLIFNKKSEEIYEFNFVNAAAWFMPKKTFLNVGGFDPIFFLYGEDVNYCQRVIYHGFKIGITINSIIFHDSKNDNYTDGQIGSDKYFRQFVNSFNIKYADVNKDIYKVDYRFKFYLIRKVILKVFMLKFKDAFVEVNKFKLINSTKIKNSIALNRQSNSNYLDI
jgi:GT2 family glycosyltransferase